MPDFHAVPLDVLPLGSGATNGSTSAEVERRVVHTLESVKWPAPKRKARMLGAVHSRATAIYLGVVRPVELMLLDEVAG